VVKTESLVAAGAVVPANTVIEPGELWAGNPARKLRDLTAAERQQLHYQSAEYVKVAATQRGVMELGGNLLLSLQEDDDEPAEPRAIEQGKPDQIIAKEIEEEREDKQERFFEEEKGEPVEEGSRLRRSV
jgi:hypothetical protein